MEPTFDSLNVETGLLEDIAEVRKLGADLAQTIQIILQGPMALFMSPESKHALAVYVVKAESMLRWMSQREQYYLMNKVAGVEPFYALTIEQSAGGLSDTLPASHPDVRSRLLEGIMQSPEIPDEVKKHARQEYADLLEQIQKREHIELPPNIENILRELGGKDKE